MRGGHHLDPRAGQAPVWAGAQLALAAAVFTSAYISWRPSDMLFTFSDGMFVLGALFLIAAGRVPFAPFGSFTPIWMISTTVMLGGLLLGSLLNGDPIRWLVSSMQYLFSLILLPMLLLGHGRAHALSLAKIALLGVFAMELAGIVLYIVFDGSHQELQRFGARFVSGAGRLSAFVGNANWNAALVAMSLPFLYYLRLERCIGLPFFLAGFAISLGALLLAASVTGMGSALIATIIFMVVGKARPPLKFVLSLAAAAVLFGVSLDSMPRAFQNRVAPALESGDLDEAGTYTGRMALNREAWDIAERTTIVGLGADQYRQVGADRAPVHNLYLLLWTEGGLASLIGWLALVATLFTAAMMAARYDRRAAGLALSVLSTFLIFSNAAPHMYARFWMVPLFLAMAPALLVLDRPVYRTRRNAMREKQA